MKELALSKKWVPPFVEEERLRKEKEKIRKEAMKMSELKGLKEGKKEMAKKALSLKTRSATGLPRFATLRHFSRK